MVVASQVLLFSLNPPLSLEKVSFLSLFNVLISYYSNRNQSNNINQSKLFYHFYHFLKIFCNLLNGNSCFSLFYHFFIFAFRTFFFILLHFLKILFFLLLFEVSLFLLLFFLIFLRFSFFLLRFFYDFNIFLLFFVKPFSLNILGLYCFYLVFMSLNFMF